MRGARAGLLTGFQRLIAGALARDLCAFVLPGPDVARVRGLDPVAAGLHLAITPRHASVLLIAGPLPSGLADAAAVAYAQMPRPRAILALGAGDLAPLPPADAVGALSQDGLVAALATLRQIIAKGAFAADVTDFDAPALQIQLEYSCPMHPEVVSDRPGSCPKCGMTLVPKETAANSHAGHQPSAPQPATPAQAPHNHNHSHSHGHASQDDGHQHHDQHGHQHKHRHQHGQDGQDDGHDQGDAGHSKHSEHGEHGGHSEHSKHGGHGEHGGQGGGHGGQGGGHAGGAAIAGIEAHFMSMADLTRDMPASADGLKMEWIEVPFGPFFPGLPSGLGLTLTLDGDAVARARAYSLVGGPDDAGDKTPAAFADHIAGLAALNPVAGRHLACLAVENAAAVTPSAQTATARAAAVERERIASHLGWIAGLAAQTGLVWMERRAAALQLSIQTATAHQIAERAGSLRTFLHRVPRTPLLHTKLSGRGRIGADRTTAGPVARALGLATDARRDDPIYAALGFDIVTQTDGDALARLRQRCAEIDQSLDLIAAAGDLSVAAPEPIGAASGHGEASVETSRGAARLTVELQGGRIAGARFEPPSAAHLKLVGEIAESQEIGDALIAVGSLDLSPWGLSA